MGQEQRKRECLAQEHKGVQGINPLHAPLLVKGASFACAKIQWMRAKSLLADPTFRLLSLLASIT